MRLRSANLLSLGVALPLMTGSLPAAANENDAVMRVVDDFCANPRDKLKDVGVKASRLGFGAEYSQKRGPPPVHGAWLPKLGSGSILTFSAKSASESVNDCKLVSHVSDLADLVARLKTKFDLGEPKASDSSVQLTMKGQKSIGGKAYAVELVYGFEQNKPSGAFTLTTTR
jgi:hypothetical protein